MRCTAVYQWTLNVATRGVLTHLENTKNHFRQGLRPGSRWGSSRRSPGPLVGWPHSPSHRRLRHLDSRRLWRLATRRLRGLGSAPRSRVPLYLSGVAPNGFSWRRAYRRGLAMRILSFRPSVCLSNACFVTKRYKDLSRFIYHTKEHEELSRLIIG